MGYDTYKYMVNPSNDAYSFVVSQRIARLATTDIFGQPHLIPVCFIYTNGLFFSVIDQKPKNVLAMQLKRIRNISKNPKVALLFDRYREQWDELAYVMVQGTAKIIETETEKNHLLEFFGRKYHQYTSMDLKQAPLIEITPRKFLEWGATGLSEK
mgnify:CR=1 FL=1|jgi:PPOX class probable F420-dependent enzyme